MLSTDSTEPGIEQSVEQLLILPVLNNFQISLNEYTHGQ